MTWESRYLGLILCRPENLTKAEVSSEWFLDRKNLNLYLTLSIHYSNNNSFDLVVLHELLRKFPWYEGAGWLSELADSGCGISLDHCVEGMYRDWQVNKLRQLTQQALEESDIRTGIEKLQSGLIDLCAQRGKTFESIGQLSEQWFQSQKETGNVLQVFTGDAYLDGNWLLDKGGLHILAARPGMGKTALMIWIAEALASQGNPVMIFSLEMSALQLTERLISKWLNVPSQFLPHEVKQNSDNVLRTVQGANFLPIYISDQSAQTIERINLLARLAKTNKNIQCILIDYIQLIRTTKATQNREQEVSHISAHLKALAKDLNVPVIALSQLNRSVESRDNKRPALSDLRDSGSLEQDADTVAMLYRPEYYLQMLGKDIPHDQQGTLELVIAKQRRLGPKKIIGHFSPQTNSFSFSSKPIITI